MKPILSILQYNCNIDFPDIDGIEKISLHYNGDKEVFMLNNLLRLCNGTYVVTLRNGDIPNERFLDSLITVLGTNRDVILFNSVTTTGLEYNYTILQRKYSMENDSLLANPKYFHCVKRSLLQSVMFQPVGNAFDQYSNRIRRVCFTEYKINDVLMTTDNV